MDIVVFMYNLNHKQYHICYTAITNDAQRWLTIRSTELHGRFVGKNAAACSTTLLVKSIGICNGCFEQSFQRNVNTALHNHQ